MRALIVEDTVCSAHNCPTFSAFRKVPEDMRGVRGHADERDLAGGRRGDAQVHGELPAPGPLPLHEGEGLIQME